MSDIMTPQAKDLTDEDREKRAEACYELDQQIKGTIRVGREALWETARLLYDFDEANAWSAIGYAKLGEWLADTEIGMTRTTYYRLTSTWRELVVLRQLPAGDLAELDVSKVDVVLPAIKSGKVGLEDALEDSKALGMKDLRARYYSRPDPNQKGPEENDGPIDQTHSPAPVEDEAWEEPPVDVDPWGGDTVHVTLTVDGEQDPTDGTVVPDAVVVDDSEPAPPRGKLEAQDLIESLDAAIAEGARRQLLNAATEARRFLRMVYDIGVE